LPKPLVRLVPIIVLYLQIKFKSVNSCGSYRARKKFRRHRNHFLYVLSIGQSEFDLISDTFLRLFLLTINSCNSIGTGTAYQLNPTQLLISISTQVLTFFFFTNKNIYNFYIFQIRQRVQAI
jgi:hypothetical protein